VNWKCIIIICYLLLINYANHTFAEQNPFYLGFSIFHSMEKLDEKNSQEKFTNPVDISFDDSNGFQLRAGVIFNELLSAEARLESISSYEDVRQDRYSKVDAINFGLNCKAKYYMPLPVQPYGLLGLGLLNSREDTNLYFDSSSLTDWGMSVKMGIGMDIFITPTFSTGLETTYTMGTGNVDHIKYINLSFGFDYRF